MVEQKQNEEKFLTIKEACTFLKCSETKLWRLRKYKKLKSYQNGRGILLKKSELENYINSSKK
jgi:excisionase family DNA binding protein